MMAAVAVGPENCVSFHRNMGILTEQMSDEQIRVELADQEIQTEPVLDEFTLAKLAEMAEYEDRRIRAVICCARRLLNSTTFIFSRAVI
jgi:hypothetical protein